MDNKVKVVKSDLPLYYGAAAVLLIMVCVCIILIFRNVFSGNAGGDSALKRKTQVEDVQNISETGELKISHAGLTDSEENKVEVDIDDSNPVFRSQT